MWQSHQQHLGPQTMQISLAGKSGVLSFREVIDSWQASRAFRQFFSATLAACPFDAFLWETPPVTTDTLDQPFESVLTASVSLACSSPDPTPFRTHFAARPSEPVLTFLNLGGDALLIVPAPVAEVHCYTHLARFLRAAPSEQVDAFWSSVGQALRDRVSRASTWLSTAGMGVSWLHLRLDSRPKYYRHAPYKTERLSS